MTTKARRTAARAGLCGVVLLAAAAVPAAAAVARKDASPLRQKAFALPELHISTANMPVREVMDRLPNRAAWEALAARLALDGNPDLCAFIDPRTGVAANLCIPEPLIPGSGVGNTVTLASLGERLGHPVTAVDGTVLDEVIHLYIAEHADILNVRPQDVFTAVATQINPDLWQLSMAQTNTLATPPGRMVATISHGNLITIGAANWGPPIQLRTAPELKGEEAVDKGFAYAGGRTFADEIVEAPVLAAIAFAPPELQEGDRYVGPIGKGYGYRLAWKFRFRRRTEPGLWEVMVDAHSGEVVAFLDRDHYGTARFNGGVYAYTDTDVCPGNQSCGVMLGQVPMPFADTGLAAPNNFTNGAGVYNFPGGTATFRMNGRFFHIDAGSAFEESSTTGNLFLGGSTGQHDFETPVSPFGGNNPPARTAFYELNKIAELARGYLPNNTWLRQQQFVYVNDDSLSLRCNAFFSEGFGVQSLHFFPSGEEEPFLCRNTGEITGVLDHEWGHGLDRNDASGDFSSSSESYGDIAALLRSQSSCQGPGFFKEPLDAGCGTAADGSGPNTREDDTGLVPAGHYCANNCSGVRDADWGAHTPAVPVNAVDFVCRSCFEDPVGPCGREVHCAAAPSNQAAWDLVARDLQAPPYNLDRQSAFIVGSKLFYQGSGNIGSWYACACGGTSNGCAAENAYIQWAAADDDNGSLLDGTPHMNALFAAFDRHGIACKVIAHLDSGCGGGPATAPNLTVASGPMRATLSWNAVPGATRYWVYRTEGHAGCDWSKTLVAEVAGIGYVDTEVAGARPYYYSVVAAGASTACYTRTSNCVSATPAPPTFGVACAPSTVSIPNGTGSGTTSCTVTGTGGFATPVTLGCTGFGGATSCHFTPSTVTPTGSAGLRVTTLLLNPGTYSFQVRATPVDNPLGAKSVPMILSVGSTGPDAIAAYNAQFQAPACLAAGSRSCDTGAALVRGRGPIGPEPDQPNTIGSTCADGSAFISTFDGTIDRIVAATIDGTPLAPGKEVTITANVTARASFTEDTADYFSAADAHNPSWVLVGSVKPTASGAQTLKKKFVLPAGAVQAIRVQYRRSGSAVPCSAGTTNDRDDLVFAVGSAGRP